MTLILILLGLTMPVTPRKAYALASWYVSPAGNDASGCRSPAFPCATLNGALVKASPGDVILVAEGIYSGDTESIVSIDKNITLSGGWQRDFSTQNGYSIIDGSGVDPGVTRNGITLNESYHAIIERFIIQNIPESTSPDGANTGVYNAGTLTLKKCQIKKNSSNSSGGGIINSGNLTMIDSRVIGNHAYQNGGGINSANGSRTILNRVTIQGNRARSSGGGIYDAHSQSMGIYSSVIGGNNSGLVGYGFGAGLRSNSDLFIMRNSVVEGNEILSPNPIYSTTGAGISLSTKVTIIENSLIRNNSGSKTGGGIFISSTSKTHFITNTVITSNLAAEEGGGIYNFNYMSSLTLSNSTVSGNTSQKGGGIFGMGRIILQNTLIANNQANQGPDCRGTIQSRGYNLIERKSGCSFSPGAGDLLGVDPGLGPSYDILDYLPLSPDSQAIDAGNPAGCKDGRGNLLDQDQRGAPRLGICDIGAYEFADPGQPAKLILVSGDEQSALTYQGFEFPFKVMVVDSIGSPVFGEIVHYTASNSGASGIFQDSGNPSASLTADDWGVSTPPVFTANGTPGNYTVRATVENPGLSVDFSLVNLGPAFIPLMTR